MDEHSLNSEKEAQDLFSQMSKAVRNLDHDAIDRLATEPEPSQTQSQPVETPTNTDLDNKVVEEDAPAADLAAIKPGDNQAEDKATEAKAPEGGAEDTSAQDPKEAELAKLRSQLEQQNQLVHKLRSDAGRVPSLQRKLDEFDRKLREIASKPSTSAASARDDNRVLSEKLAQIREVDPVIADGIEEAIKNAIADMRQEYDKKFEVTNSFIEEDRTDATIEREWNKLVQQVPNAQEVFQHPLWSEWKSEQPDQWKTLASSMYADDVVIAMEKFSRDMIQRYPELANQQQPQQVQQVQTPVKQEPTVAAQKVKEERDRKLKGSTGATNSTNMDVASELDEQALFKKIFNEQVKKFERTGG